jgi:hypothetical protein
MGFSENEVAKQGSKQGNIRTETGFKSGAKTTRASKLESSWTKPKA